MCLSAFLVDLRGRPASPPLPEPLPHPSPTLPKLHVLHTRARTHTHTHNLHCHCHKSTCCIRSLQSESCGVRAGLVLSLIERMVCPCHWRAGVLWVVNEVGVHPWRLCVHANPTFATAWAGQRTPMQLAWMSRKSLAEVKPCSV